MDNITPVPPYFAAVVQVPLYGLNDREPERQTMCRNAGRVVDIMDRIIALSDTAPKLIVLPVLCFIGIGTAMRLSGRQININVNDVAVDLNNDRLLDPILEACARHGCYVVSSCVEKHPAMPGRYFHTGFVLGPKGLVLRSPKTQAPTSAGITLIRDAYKEYVDAFGSEAILPVAETPIGKIGCLVEGEFLVSEATRTLARKGAEIIVHPTATHYGPGNPPYTAIQQTLAYTNGVFWLSGVPSAEFVEMSDGRLAAEFGGGAAIVGPDGVILGMVQGIHEGHATAKIDLVHLYAVRPELGRHTVPADIVYRTLYQ